MSNRDDDNAFFELNDVLPALDATYGAPVSFAQGHPMMFPDFELIYRGRNVSPLTGYTEWVFRLRSTDGELEITMASGGAVSEPGASWTVNGHTFSMVWIRRKGEPLTQIIVNPAP